MKYNVEPTASTIESAANLLEDKARELRYLAKQMRERQDLTYASEAINVLAGSFCVR